MSANAITSLPIPRSGLEYDRDASLTSTFKTGSNSRYDLSYGTNTYDQDERLYGVTGQNKYCSYGVSFSKTALAPTSILSTTSHLRSELVGFMHDLNTRSSRLTTLVELATVERARLENTSSHASDLNRRIPDRVGCSNGPVVHPRPMDEHRKTESYQLSATEDCFVCSSALVTSTETSDCGSSVGQYNDCGLPTQGGGHTIQIPALLSSGDSDLGQPKQDSAATKLSTRSDEYASRRSVTFKGARRMDVGPYSKKEDFLDFNMPTVDLFASERSKQVPRYFTKDRRDPHALGTDALQQSWDFKNQLLYALSLSVRIPHRLPKSSDTILNLTTNRRLTDYSRLHMMVWLISAQPLETEGLNLKWPVSFKTPGNPPPGSNMQLSGDNGQRGVAERALMQLPLLP